MQIRGKIRSIYFSNAGTVLDLPVRRRPRGNNYRGRWAAETIPEFSKSLEILRLITKQAPSLERPSFLCSSAMTRDSGLRGLAFNRVDQPKCEADFPGANDENPNARRLWKKSVRKPSLYA